MTDRYFDTSAIVLNHNFYCPYCGKQLKDYTEMHGQFDVFYYHNCDCIDAEKEHELRMMIKEHEQAIISLKMQMPKPKFKLQEQIVQIPYKL